MKFYIIYEKNAIATMDSDIEGPYKSFEKAKAQSARFDETYDTSVVCQINDCWYRLEDGDNEVFCKLFGQEDDYWIPLSQVNSH